MTHRNQRAPQLQEEEEPNKTQLPPNDVKTEIPGNETCHYVRDGNDRLVIDNEESSLQSSESSSVLVEATRNIPTRAVITEKEEEMRGKESSMEESDNGRERLKKHRIEVAGRVWIPEIWGQEELSKDWIDCSAFDASLVPSGIISARAALVKGRRANSSRIIRVENRC